MGEGGALAAIMGAGIAMIIVYLLIAVVLIVSYWKIYTKAGKPGWAAIVPIHFPCATSFSLFLNMSAKSIIKYDTC